MADTRTRTRERRQHRHQRRITRERRDDERMTGFALQHAEDHSLLRIFLGDRRAYKLLAGFTAVSILLWLALRLFG